MGTYALEASISSCQEEKRTKGAQSWWETWSADDWGVSLLSDCQCQGNRTEVSPESERLLKPGPLHLYGRQETDSLCSMGRRPGRGRKQAWQVRVMDSHRDRTRVWTFRPEFAFSLNFSEQKLYWLGVINSSTPFLLFWECSDVEINSTVSSIYVPLLKEGLCSFFPRL